jgi:hypothetical protein
MSDYDRKTTVNVEPTTTSSTGGGLYFIVGGLVVAVLVGAYFIFGMPGGTRSNIATTPDNKTSITIEQPRAPATPPAATPAPAAPAAPAAPRQ